MNPIPNTIPRQCSAVLWNLANVVPGLTAFVGCWFATTGAYGAGAVLPGLTNNLVCYYDFEHPVTTNPALESDLGFSGTDIQLVNGGAAMRIDDGAYPGSSRSLKTQQVNPTTSGNDDWKAGIYDANGVATLSAFGSVTGITLMGWVKPTGTNPSPNTVTPSPGDYYNAIGLFGVLSGTSEGHLVRALIEIISVNNSLRIVALGRRLDNGNSLVLAATDDWQDLLPNDTWTHLTATFDFDNGVMALYQNGRPLPAAKTSSTDAWNIIGGAEPDVTSATSPAGIKIGGSFPQNNIERNPFNGRFDDLMFFNRVLDPNEVERQYANFFAVSATTPVLTIGRAEGELTLSWPVESFDFALESKTDLAASGWELENGSPRSNEESFMMTVPATDTQQFFRLKKP